MQAHGDLGYSPGAVQTTDVVCRTLQKRCGASCQLAIGKGVVSRLDWISQIIGYGGEVGIGLIRALALAS